MPTKSEMVNPKMEYETMSGAFIWEDEGLWDTHHHFAWTFRHVIHHRTKLVMGPQNNIESLSSGNFDKQVFELAKKYYPDWIGFDEPRCSYNPKLAERMIRIIKVANWRIDKLMKKIKTIAKTM
ncbi:hypothetical protein [Aquimarina sp. 2201CG5-10]|uniref:hypothetical protein n=1 Tax=Aquimarina callyspongiae TaxID=3098150 RepID=UPI002AB3F27A|nr:hypothetical protein [Aquimarina sp. 2201CG5-10]MDY8137480.1 hypothetical protein [Aquimarina sp. 2201CG5-10]